MTPPALVLRHPHGRWALADLAARVAERDPASVLRVVVRERRVAVFAPTPFDVLVVRAAELSEEAAEGAAEGTGAGRPGLDLVVEAATLAATVAGEGSGDGTGLRLPPALDPLRWTWPLPPWSGWEPEGTVALAVLRAARAAGVAAFRARVESLPAADRTTAVLQRVADEQWAVPVVPGVDVRTAHAAAAYGLLGGATAEARVSARGPWRRLELPAGAVLWRRGGLVLRG